MQERDDVQGVVQQVEEKKAGGLDATINERARSGEDLHCYQEQNWYELRAGGSQPERRANHSAFVYGSK